MQNMDMIREHMPVIGSDGRQIGLVDHMEGQDRIKLTRDSSPDGQHHFIPCDWIDHIDAHVHLKVSCDEAQKRWQ
ncbi:DUF2171 domain-containing protein [Prosthecomicrobium sp. N25]|uniref:DUF2171 domain-containing protein n=1 Tax=Prosthecomicrobium sp. N25 TaxID=3129254 RepID=UPI0030782971